MKPLTKATLGVYTPAKVYRHISKANFELKTKFGFEKIESKTASRMVYMAFLEFLVSLPQDGTLRASLVKNYIRECDPSLIDSISRAARRISDG